MDPLIAGLQAIVGERYCLTDAGATKPYLTDWRGLYRGRTPLVLRPGSTEEAAEIVRLCAEARVAIVPQGGNTGLVGGSVPDAGGEQILVSMSRLNRIRALDAEDFTMTAEAGCVLADAQQAARHVRCGPTTSIQTGQSWMASGLKPG